MHRDRGIIIDYGDTLFMWYSGEKGKRVLFNEVKGERNVGNDVSFLELSST